MSKAGERLIQSAKDALAIARGEASAAVIHVPDVPPKRSGKGKGRTRAKQERAGRQRPEF